MATDWVKKSRTQRMSNASAVACPMSFNSGVFTHALAKLAIEKRTEREKVALVEALLLSRMSGNAKKAEAKLIEFKQLRHKLVRDNWNKAIHQVIIQYNIPDRVKKKRAMADARQEEVAEQQQQLKSAMKHQQRKIDTPVRFNLQESSGVQSCSSRFNHNSTPTRQMHVTGHPVNSGLAGEIGPADPQFMHQQPSSFQSLQSLQPHSRLALSATSQPFIPNGRLHPVSSQQPELAPGCAAALQSTTRHRQAAFGPRFGSLEEDLGYRAASNAMKPVSDTPRIVPQHDRGRCPTAAARQPQKAATAHRPSEHRTSASLSSCPTESSQTSSTRPPERPPSHSHAASAAPWSQSAAASSHSFKATASSRADDRSIVAAVSSGKHNSSQRPAARGLTATPSCTTESSSDAGLIHVNPPMDACALCPPGFNHHLPIPLPASLQWSNRCPPSSPSLSSVAGCTEATESSVSVTHVQVRHEIGVQNSISQRGSSRNEGPADDVQTWQRTSASQSRQGSDVGSSMILKPHAQETWGTPQELHKKDVGVSAAAIGRSVMQMSVPGTSHSHGVQEGSSSGSFESSSRPSVGRSDTSGQQMRQDLAAQAARGFQGDALYGTGLGVSWGGQVRSQCGVGAGHMTGSAGRGSPVGWHARTVNHCKVSNLGSRGRIQTDQSSSAPMGHCGQTNGGNGSCGGASRGSETTESSDDEA